MSIIGRIALTLGLIVSAFLYFFVVDGNLPRTSDFNPSLTELRALANAPAEQRPVAIEMEVFASDQVPALGLQAGLDFADATLVHSVFRLRSHWGDTLIDVGMDRYVAEAFETGERFDNESLARIASAIRTARRIVVTHEHPDHLGYLPRFPSLDAIAPNVRLTREQIEGTSQYMESGRVAKAWSWRRKLDAGKASTNLDLAHAEDVSDRYIGRMIKLAYRCEKIARTKEALTWNTDSRCRRDYHAGRPNLSPYGIASTKACWSGCIFKFVGCLAIRNQHRMRASSDDFFALVVFFPRSLQRGA